MTLKINKFTTPPKRRTRPTKTGWHSLDVDELLLWSYMWFERKENCRFSEPIRQWALRLHTTHPTLLNRLQKLIAVNVVYPDRKNTGKMDDGWKMTSVYTVTEPPASVLRLTQAMWEVDAERGKALPSGQKVEHGETRINTGAPSGQKADHIATTNGQNSYKSVISNRPLSIDSVGGQKADHGETSINIDDSRGQEVEHDAKNLRAALAEEQDELATWERVGNKKGAEACHQRIAKLKAQLSGGAR